MSESDWGCYPDRSGTPTQKCLGIVKSQSNSVSNFQRKVSQKYTGNVDQLVKAAAEQYDNDNLSSKTFSVPDQSSLAPRVWSTGRTEK